MAVYFHYSWPKGNGLRIRLRSYYSARGSRIEVSALPLFIRVVLNMQASIACVLGLVTRQSNMHIWRDCCVAASGVGRYQNMLEVDFFFGISRLV